MPQMKTRRRSRLADTYLALIEQFPLRTIKNDVEHERATAIVSGMMGRKLDAGSGDYLDALLVLVNKYEDEHHAVINDMTAREALRALMEFNQLSQADIGRIIGSESAVSMFLRGERGLSKAQIRKLAERFKLDPTVFLT